METEIILITIGLWLVFGILAILNAIIRNQLYRPYFGDLRAHQASSLIFIIIILVVTFFTFRLFDLNLNDIDALEIGAIWLCLTISFKFFAGHFIFGNLWKDIFTDYNILRGRIWILVLFSTFIAPYLINRII